MPGLLLAKTSAVVGSLQFFDEVLLNDAFDSRAEVALPAEGVGINTSGSFCFEFWFRPSSTAADNNYTAVTAGANYDTNGNIMFDRDLNSQEPGFLIGISAGLLYFTCVNTSQTGYCLVGSHTDCRDGNWHHGAVWRNSSTGLVELFLDGDRVASGTGPTGTLAMPDAHSPLGTCGASGLSSCSNSDPYLVLGQEKHEFQSNGFIGWMTCVRESSTQRYSGATYIQPSGPFSNDANTLGLWQMKEGLGTTIADESGNDQTMNIVADASGPQWSASSPF